MAFLYFCVSCSKYLLEKKLFISSEISSGFTDGCIFFSITLKFLSSGSVVVVETCLFVLGDSGSYCYLVFVVGKAAEFVATGVFAGRVVAPLLPFACGAVYRNF